LVDQFLYRHPEGLALSQLFDSRDRLTPLFRAGSSHRDKPCYRLSVPSDRELLAVLNPLEERRKASFRLVDTNLVRHDTILKLVNN
jgi:hypothetical protein